MPAEPTKAKLKRRTSRRDIDEFKFDGSHAREIELKRNRGAFPYFGLVPHSYLYLQVKLAALNAAGLSSRSISVILS